MFGALSEYEQTFQRGNLYEAELNGDPPHLVAAHALIRYRGIH